MFYLFLIQQGKIQELDYVYVKDKLEFKPGESYLLMGDLNVLQKLVESNKQAAFCNVFFLAHVTGPQPSTNGASLLRHVFSYKIDEQEELVLLRKVSFRNVFGVCRAGVKRRGRRYSLTLL